MSSKFTTSDVVNSLHCNGYAIIDCFLDDSEASKVQEAFYQEFAKPLSESSPISEIDPQRAVFPWASEALNFLALNPTAVKLAKEIIGTPEIRLCEAHLEMRYADMTGMRPRYGTKNIGIHTDFKNNTLGPFREDDDFQHLLFFYYLSDVSRRDAPIKMLSRSSGDAKPEPFLGKAGSLCIYTPFTSHVASDFEGGKFRAAAWIGYSMKDRPWDGARYFNYKTGANEQNMSNLIASMSFEELELLGFPSKNSELWTENFLIGMRERYPGFDPSRKNVRTI